MVNVPSPAISIVGRHNSGKTTLIELLIAEMVARGFDVGSVKHHSHEGFAIDIPGKDSYRHRAAGASETVIAAPGQVARVKTIDGELECDDIVASMPGHDIIVVEGYRKSGLPAIEIMRSGNEADRHVASVLHEQALLGAPLGTDFIQESRGNRGYRADVTRKMPTANTVAIVTDIDEACKAAELYGIPVFHLDEVSDLASFLEHHYVRPRISVVIQAGGESKRMGQSKATVSFLGRPLICRLVERLSPVADELIITTNEPENLGFLVDMFPEVAIRLVRDKFDCRGALPGLYTAFEAASYAFVAVVACDMVFASSALVVAEALVMAEEGADVVVPVNKHGFEPFHALYRRDTCLPVALAAIERGEQRAQAVFKDKDLRVHLFSRSEVLKSEPMGGCFVNANTPGELRHLENALLEA